MKRADVSSGLFMVLIVVMFLFVSIGEAVSLLEMNTTDLTNSADIIIVGRAKDSWSQWEGKRIYTYTQVIVDEVVKGDIVKSEVIEVKTPGGKIDDIEMYVPGAPALTRDAEYMLFLYSDTESYMSNVVGWQGKYTIENGAIKENDKSLDGFIKEVKAIIEAE